LYPGAHARTTPDKPAVVMAESGEVLTYRALDEGSARLARWLHERGLRRGDAIALLCDNQPRFFEVVWAALRSGLYVTPINHHLAGAEASYIVADCGAKALLASAACAHLATKIDAPNVAHRLAFGGPIDGYGEYEAAMSETSVAPLAEQPQGVEMLYSSGTTGRPKGIQLTLLDRSVAEPDRFTLSSAPAFGLDAAARYLSPAPLYHSAPLRFGLMVHRMGGTVIAMERFDAEGALCAVEAHRATNSQWVPTMFVRMLKLPERSRCQYDLSSLQLAIHAAAPCPVEVKRSMIEWWGPILLEYYGATEGHGSTMIDSETWLRKPGSVGQATSGIIHVCDDDGHELGTGEPGTIYFEQPEVPFSYHGDPEKTREAQHPLYEKWTTTGDVGYLDGDGFLFLVDRKAFMIISGGVNIYPQEVEDCLTMHPSVHDVAVIGVPDDDMGEAVRAVVQLADDVAPSAETERELIEYVRGRIAHFKAPRRVDFVGELPRTPAGKLVKGRLREGYVVIRTGASGGADSSC
jgi:long-chain acyl-CoA synthetase